MALWAYLFYLLKGGLTLNWPKYENCFVFPFKINRPLVFWLAQTLVSFRYCIGGGGTWDPPTLLGERWIDIEWTQMWEFVFFIKIKLVHTLVSFRYCIGGTWDPLIFIVNRAGCHWMADMNTIWMLINSFLTPILKYLQFSHILSQSNLILSYWRHNLALPCLAYPSLA